MEINLDFKKWLNLEGIAGATGAVYDSNKKSRDWNWEGAAGVISGVSPKEDPIGIKKKKKKKKKL